MSYVRESCGCCGKLKSCFHTGGQWECCEVHVTYNLPDAFIQNNIEVLKV